MTVLRTYVVLIMKYNYNFLTKVLALIFISSGVVTATYIPSAWHDEIKMRPYYTAVQLIRKNFESTIKTDDQNYDLKVSGFNSHPIPNPYYNRTPCNLYLETYSDEHNNEIIHRLWSPFGCIEFFDTYFNDRTIISKIFLDSMQQTWSLYDVTKIVTIEYFTNDELSEPYSFYQHPWQGSSAKSKLYLIAKIDGKIFQDPADIPTTPQFMFAFYNIKFKTLCDFNNFFYKISSSTNKF